MSPATEENKEVEEEMGKKRQKRVYFDEMQNVVKEF
jgi:hypothetical protein